MPHEPFIVEDDASRLLDAKRMTCVIRAGCTEAEVHLMCSYPDCSCKQLPVAVKTAIRLWELLRTETV